MIKKIIANLILLNWKEIKNIPNDKIEGSVIIGAPHTSNWDLYYSIGYLWKNNLDFKFFIKNDYTKSFWVGWFIKWLGGIGVDRSQKNDLVNYAASLFKTFPKIIILIPAEGSRNRGEKWKLGFYYIAITAKVPITLSHTDYEKREIGITKQVFPSLKERRELFNEIELNYKDVRGKYPEKFTPNIE